MSSASLLRDPSIRWVCRGGPRRNRDREARPAGPDRLGRRLDIHGGPDGSQSGADRDRGSRWWNQDAHVRRRPHLADGSLAARRRIDRSRQLFQECCNDT